MTGAMFSAVAGLRTHMQALNVIGNNVANVNTNGYKSGRYVFQSALYTSLRSGSNGSDTVGGKNPSQIGFGSNVGTIDINMTTSNYVSTGKASDCMIDGDGFFLVGNKGLTFEAPQDFKALTLTRVGDIEFKAGGYLCKPDGSIVYGFSNLGFAADGKTPVISNQLQEISKPKVTADGQIVYSREQYDMIRNASEDDGGDEGTVWPTYDELSFAMFDSISIDEGTGQISGILSDTNQNIIIGFIAIGTVDNPNGVTQQTGTYYRCGDGAGEIYISMLGNAGQQVYDSSMCTYVPRVEMVDEETGETTVIAAHWSVNGLDEIQGDGDDAIAQRQAVMDGARLTHVNGSVVVNAAGETVAASDGMRVHSGGTTGLLTNGLEQTDTDLATEIANMIMVQRGYQANTRIITVTDTMLEELVNMKR